VFLRSTNVGIAIRASAERSDRASLLGVPVKRLQTVVWCVAATLSVIGVFLKSGVVGLAFASNQGFGTTSFSALLVALAALTLGRFTNLPAIALSAVALGVLEQAVVWNNGNNPALVYPVMAVVILVGLAVRKTGQARAEHDTASTWSASDEVRPIPNELRRVPEVLVVKWGGFAVIAYCAWRLPTLGAMNSGRMLLASAVVVFAIVGVSIILLPGWAGQVSLGQMAFVGVGAAAGAIATKTWGLDLMLAMPIAGIAGALMAVVVGLPALRVRGLFLAVTTLAFAITASNFLLNPQYVKWIPKGRIERPPLFGKVDLDSQEAMYYLCLVVLLLTILAVGGIRQSRTGRVWLALRENERGAQSYGINITRAKLSAFAISGFIAAVAGCLFVHGTQQFSAAQYGAGESFTAFTSTVVGGLGSITGGVLRALFARRHLVPRGELALLPSALGVLFVLLVFPSGLGGMVFRLRDLWLRSVARRYDVVVPSLLADVGSFEEPDDVVEHAEETAEAVDPLPAEPVAPAGGGPR
jgi:branched-chain amino acid transport system permease protein